MPEESSGLSVRAILDREPIVLSDSGVELRGSYIPVGQDMSRYWYPYDVYPKKRFASIKQHVLEDRIAVTNTMIEWYNEPKVQTTQLVLEEVRIFSDMLRENLIHLNICEKHLPKNHKRKNLHMDEAVTKERKGLCEELCYKYVQMCKAIESAILPVRSPGKLEQIYELVRLIAENIWVKRIFGSRYGTPHGCREDLGTDEQLAATALYLSLCEQMPCSVLTADSDLGRIMAATFQYLRREKTPERQFFMEMITSYPIRVYFIKPDGGLEMHVDASNGVSPFLLHIQRQVDTAVKQALPIWDKGFVPERLIYNIAKTQN